MYGHVSHQNHGDTQDLASPALSSDMPLSPMHETSLSNCYLELAVTHRLPVATAALTAGAKVLPSGLTHAICEGRSDGV